MGGPVQRFAQELRKLRQDRGGITYRQMAAGVQYSAPALSQAAAGERLPSLAVTLAYVTACGGDSEEWERRWRQAAQQVAAAVAEDDGAEAPYRGLIRFEPEHREWFFGRDQLIADAMGLLRQRRFVAIVGASGSGKSSLLRAGLVAGLRTDQPPHARPAAVRVLTPGEQPLLTHGRLLAPADDEGDRVVVVDQFEEVFTLCVDAGQRSAFLELLLAARRPESRLRVVVAIRADFYGRCAEHPALAKAVGEAHLLLGPMSAVELREAIVKPAAAAGLTVERSLTTRLVEEIVDEPGGLPLLSHVLLETWRRRRGRMLTVEGYRAAGGVHGALAKTAEHLYGALTPAQAALARQILLRLITPGVAAEDTARPADRSEFATARHEDIDVVLDRLAQARLITLDDDRVQLAHEALITAWPRLHGWIEQNRERLHFHRDLTRAARAWEELHRDPGALYRGTRLAYAREWLAHDHEDHEQLNPSERAFVEASISAADTERATMTRNHRRLRYLAVSLTAALLAASAVGAVALYQRQQAVDDRQVAVSRQLAAQALGLIDSRPSTAMLLSVEAYRTAPTTEARSALLTMSTHQAYQAELTGHTNAISQVAFSPDEHSLATVSRDQTTIIWDLQRRTRRATITTHHTWLRTVAFSPDGRLLATGGDDNTIVFYDAEHGTMVDTLIGDTTRVKDLTFSPDGHVLAAAGADGTVVLWDLDHRTPTTRLIGHIGQVQAVAFSPDSDGRTVATGGADGTIGLWDRATGTRLATLTGHSASVDDIAFSPDGHTLASASPDQTIRLWDIDHHTSVATLRGHTEQVRTVAFSPDGRTLASGSHDDTVILWDLQHRIPKARLTGHTDNIYSVTFSPDGHTLASVGEDGRIILWDPTRTPLAGHTDTVTTIAFSPDGRTLATASGDRTVVLWDPRRHTEQATITTKGPVNAVAFSPDGHTMAVGGGSPNQAAGATDHSLTLWDVAHPDTPVQLAELPGHTDQIRSVAFSPDGHLLASASTDTTVILWDIQHRTPLATLRHAEAPNSVVFSPDGQTLVELTGFDHIVVLWNVADHTSSTLTFPGALPRGAAFRPDGQMLALANTDHTVALWDTHRRTQIATLTYSDTMSNVAYSPDAHLVATGAVEHTVGLWDPTTETRLATLTGHTGAVNAVAFSPDGHTLASASADRTVALWDTDPRQIITAICHALDRNLTPDEWHEFLTDTPYHNTCDTT